MLKNSTTLALTENHRQTARGFTLIEFVVALVVIAIGSALLVSIVTPTAGSADPMIQAQARAVASAYMDEILLRNHGDGPGDCIGSDRASWETVWCYNNLPAGQPPHDQFGNPIAALSNYAVTVEVSGGSPAEISVRGAHGQSGVDLALRSRRGDY